ncbi:hypothetical protein TPHA_0C04330 [Tetrapisispora phaffii CBS 4417]|uniref:thioredoxin-dependent peroxiredoxin n=1 Tax=Tetrapisispora phaffii (strain ATCC 24235 / CBS 4417 / NBRC 1672 / NRRL Y-8282 / UCD 70-5) TaxID=1071381 RepID=G8BQS1_TETPH|nr:hypothetical protein TPHA_0C04330 [Tetrapisispora phaffii CBS 4417]CCE62583.1 hypothetical protein TPHA_0C04330 [Tetrapisispora phaffii CBS 4417]
MTEVRRSSRIANKKIIHQADVKAEHSSKVSKKAKTTVKKTLSVSKIETDLKETQKDDYEEIQVGDEIPDLTLENQEGEELSLRDLAQKNKIITIFVYPRASTPGCTRQACGFRDNFDDLKKYSLILGLSGDSITAQKHFKTKQNLPYDLLCDTEKKLITILGCKKKPSGIIRSYFIFVDGKLKLKRVKVSPEVSITESKKEILDLVKEL